MWLIRAALRRPITILVAVIAIALTAILALTRMPVDIFPNLNLPVIYVAQPYGGMSPAQMEGYLVYYYEYHFLYITGIESVESKSIQNIGLLKLTFHPGTNMAEALAQTISYVNRAHAFMPYGTVPPFVVRFDAGSVPVGYLVFSSQTRSLGEIQDLALNRVRPIFATLPGVSAPPPFGGNQRTIVVSVNPDRLRAYGMSPEEVVKAVSSSNTIIPAGNIRSGDLLPMVPINSVATNINDLLDTPIRTGAGPTIFLRDVGNIADSSDILAGYALVNGRRAIYLSVTKRADASTLDVVNEVKQNLQRFRSLVPEDIKVSYEFDQSSYVKSALSSLMREGALGAILTGLMVLLFLRDLRSSAIVVTTIPFALLTAVVALWAAGQTINIMTLGGLALAIGILVDEATVAIENIHTHMAQNVPRARAVLDASTEVVIPRLLAMLSVLSVFVPSFFMTGVAKSLFVPLSLAVGFAMAASYFLSSSLVPVMSTWILRERHVREPKFFRWTLSDLRDRLGRCLRKLVPIRGIVLLGYLAVTFAIIFFVDSQLGREIFPRVTAGQFQLRFRAPTGTRVVATEAMALRILDEIKNAASPQNVDISLGYVGTQPPAYPINTIFLWTSGSHEGVLRVSLRPGSSVSIADLEEHLRRTLPPMFPGGQFSFEAGDLVSQIMNFGAPTPIEVAIRGPNFSDVRSYEEKVRNELASIRGLRDLQLEQSLEYPTIDVHVNRELAGQLSLTMEQVGRSVVDATSSSRFMTPNYWADPKTGIAYQVQVQVPQNRMSSVQDIANVPLGQGLHPLLGDVAEVTNSTAIGEYDRLNGQRMLTLSANIAKNEDLGRASHEVAKAIERAGSLPRGVSVALRGQIAPMQETLTNLMIGLGVAIIVIFLLLAANFQSMRLSAVVLSTIPAVVAGVVLMLLITRTTLNLQSFMGAIMAIGVAVANAILLVTFAEQYRLAGNASTEASIHAAQTRMRPVLMTSMAMIAGMIPMALALGTGAEQTAPLARAVIGGLLAATLTTLFVLPSVLSFVQEHASTRSASLDPEDPASAYAHQRDPNPGGSQ
jgi:multidrug efflux pump subunit AcrB